MAATIPVRLTDQFDDALASELVGLRRAIHQHPELAFQERETAARLSV